MLVIRLFTTKRWASFRMKYYLIPLYFPDEELGLIAVSWDAFLALSPYSILFVIRQLQ